jgi:hypothetical protein
MPDVEQFAGTAPPRILATSSLVLRTKPLHAATAALSPQQKLDRQIAHARVRAQYHKTLPITQEKFMKQRQKG